MSAPPPRQWTFPVEATQIQLFARAIGDDNPAFRDADSPEAEASGGIVAPPTFGMIAEQFDPEHYARPRPGQPWFGSGATPGFAFGPQGLHASQEFTYHRDIRPGDVLTVELRTGDTWEKEGKRAGKMRFVEYLYDYRDAQGELVLSVRRVRVLLDQPPAGSA
ncbi:FAS1-like dehydratase domain-containing protein [Ramlibacter sp.]|uniref:FAS1-like dehydratase domain-containing protein n=1 Tax=Ramlibacter sp. TaxID=1917967 RepID=UPI003D1532D0